MKTLNLLAIRIDGETQAREAINQEAVADYAEALRACAEFPPMVVFFDGAEYWLADGFHRWHAHRAAEKASAQADVRNGTRRDAVLFSLGANAAHGLRRTNADKRKAVLTLLNDAEWAKWTQGQIAKACGVSREYVSRLQADLSCDRSQDAPAVRTVERAGKTYDQNTANIGRQQPQASPKITPAPAQAPQEPEYTDLDAARDQISDLQHEVERLSDRLAVEAIDASEEEKTAASETIATLRAEVKTLTAHLEAVTIARDTLQEENAQLKRQCQMYRGKLDKLEKP